MKATLSSNKCTERRGSSLGLSTFTTPEHLFLCAAPLEQGRGRSHRCQRPLLVSLETHSDLVFKSVSCELFVSGKRFI